MGNQFISRRHVIIGSMSLAATLLSRTSSAAFGKIGSPKAFLNGIKWMMTAETPIAVRPALIGFLNRPLEEFADGVEYVSPPPAGDRQERVPEFHIKFETAVAIRVMPEIPVHRSAEFNVARGFKGGLEIPYASNVEEMECIFQLALIEEESELAGTLTLAEATPDQFPIRFHSFLSSFRIPFDYKKVTHRRSLEKVNVMYFGDVDHLKPADVKYVGHRNGRKNQRFCTFGIEINGKSFVLADKLTE